MSENSPEQPSSPVATAMPSSSVKQFYNVACGVFVGLEFAILYHFKKLIFTSNFSFCCLNDVGCNRHYYASIYDFLS